MSVVRATGPCTRASTSARVCTAAWGTKWPVAGSQKPVKLLVVLPRSWRPRQCNFHQLYSSRSFKRVHLLRCLFRGYASAGLQHMNTYRRTAPTQLQISQRRRIRCCLNFFFFFFLMVPFKEPVPSKPQPTSMGRDPLLQLPHFHASSIASRSPLQPTPNLPLSWTNSWRQTITDRATWFQTRSTSPWTSSTLPSSMHHRAPYSLTVAHHKISKTA